MAADVGLADARGAKEEQVLGPFHPARILGQGEDLLAGQRRGGVEVEVRKRLGRRQA